MSERITIDDVRKAGHCVAGVKAWSDAHGFDFRDFLKHGVSAEELLRSGDGLSLQVIERKRERERSRGRE